MIAADLLSYLRTIHRDHERSSAAAIWFPQAVDSDIPGRRRRAAPASTNFTGAVTAVHRDAPWSPQVVHSAAHKDVLTIGAPGLASPGRSPRVRAARRFRGRGANGPQRSERPPAMSLRRPRGPGHDPNSLNAGIVGVACHAVRHETSAEARPAAGLARPGHVPDRHRPPPGRSPDGDGRRGGCSASWTAAEIVRSLRPPPDRGISAETADRVLTLLAVGGALDDFPVHAYGCSAAPPAHPAGPGTGRRVPGARGRDGGARTLARRLRAQVRVDGAGSVGNALPASSRFGHRPGHDRGPTRTSRKITINTRWAWNVTPGVPRPVPAGRARRRPPASRSRDPRRPPSRELRSQPQARAGPAPGGFGRRSDRRGRPAGAAGPDGVPAVPGPDPGRARPRLAAHPGSARAAAAQSARLRHALAAAVAAQAAAQALAFVDRAHAASPVTNGTLELVLPGWQWRRRTWPRHPGCGVAVMCLVADNGSWELDLPGR